MKKFQVPLLIAFLSAAISLATAGDNDAAKPETAQLQGEWKMVSGSADGQPMPEAMLSQMKRVCTNDEVTVTMAGQTYIKAKFTVDPTKQPKTIDYQMTGGFTEGKKQLGIYEMDGDTFKSCFGKPGAERPTDFTSKPGDGRTLSVWKSVRPAALAPEQK